MFKQEVAIIGKVVSTAVKDRINKNTQIKNGTDYSIRVRTPEGGSIRLTTNVWEKSYNKNDASKKRFDDGIAVFRKIEEALKAGEDSYVSLRFAAVQDKKDKSKFINFSTLTAQESKDGRLYIDTEGSNFPYLLEHSVENEEVYIHFAKTKKKFSEIKTNIVVEMLVEGIDHADETVILSDGAMEFSKKVQVSFPGGAGKLDMDQGYRMVLNIKPGEIIKADEADTGEFGFEEEKKTSTGITFGPDSLVVVGGSIIKGYTADDDDEFVTF